MRLFPQVLEHGGAALHLGRHVLLDGAPGHRRAHARECCGQPVAQQSVDLGAEVIEPGGRDGHGSPPRWVGRPGRLEGGRAVIEVGLVELDARGQPGLATPPHGPHPPPEGRPSEVVPRQSGPLRGTLAIRQCAAVCGGSGVRGPS